MSDNPFGMNEFDAAFLNAMMPLAVDCQRRAAGDDALYEQLLGKVVAERMANDADFRRMLFTVLFHMVRRSDTASLIAGAGDIEGALSYLGETMTAVSERFEESQHGEP